MVKENTKIADSVYNNNFQKLLNEFEEVYNFPDDKRKKAMIFLKEKAKNKMIITFRQMEAIRDRCNNVLNGDYGNTKTAQQMSYGNPPTK